MPLVGNVSLSVATNKAVWDSQANDPDIAMFWAACCLAFFGFLRASKFTVPCELGVDPSSHLSWGDLAVDVPEQPSVMSKASNSGKALYFSSARCSAQMLAYLSVRGRQNDGPLFRFRDGKPLTRQRVVSAVRGASVKSGIQAQLYTGHSFRIGAATTAAARGMEDSVIRPLGRWKSLAYLEYIKIPRQQLATYSAKSVYCFILAIPAPSFCCVLFCILHVLSCLCEPLSPYLSHVGEVWGS